MLTLWRPRKERYLPSVFGDTMFNDFFNNQNDFMPNVDIVEQRGKLLVKVDLPGVEKEDLKLSLKEGMLTISGEKKVEHEKEEDTYYRCERAYGTFSRSFQVGETVKEEDILASFKNGTLTVTLPKAEEKQERSIAIQ